MNPVSAIPPRRAALLVLLVAAGTYGNSVLNGFAYDDNTIIEGNPVVTEGRVVDALSSSYWPQVVAGAGLYRPVTLSSFALEWRLWNGHPAGFHLVNVVVHVAVSLLVFLLILEVSATLPALVGAAIFAAHPVHSEAVANVVGRAELYSALFVVGACLLFWRDRGLAPFWRAARLLGVGAFYVMGLGSKEMAATLPALLVLLALARKDDERVTDRVRTDLPVFLLTGALLVAFLGVRFLMLGSVTGEVPSPTLVGLSAGQRILTSLVVFPQYFRLLVFPLDLVADYAPAVLFPALTWGPDVILASRFFRSPTCSSRPVCCWLSELSTSRPLGSHSLWREPCPGWIVSTGHLSECAWWPRGSCALASWCGRRSEIPRGRARLRC